MSFNNALFIYIQFKFPNLVQVDYQSTRQAAVPPIHHLLPTVLVHKDGEDNSNWVQYQVGFGWPSKCL